ncbi:MAG: outer membrane protein [Gemmatimonadales bacterium]
MRGRTLAAVAALVLGAGVGGLAAQTSFGGQINWGDDSDLGIGGRIEFGLANMVNVPELKAIGSFDYFFPDAPSGVDVTYWEINGNVAYQFTKVKGRILPYAGGGLNIAHGSASFGGFSGGDTKVGLNLMGGIDFKTSGRLTPFVEAKFEAGGGEQFVLSGGILF